MSSLVSRFSSDYLPSIVDCAGKSIEGYIINLGATRLHDWIAGEDDYKGKRVLVRQGIGCLGVYCLQRAAIHVKNLEVFLTWDPLAVAINYVAVSIFDKVVTAPCSDFVNRCAVAEDDFFIVKKIKDVVINLMLNALFYKAGINAALKITYTLTMPQKIALNMTITALALTVWGLGIYLAEADRG